MSMNIKMKLIDMINSVALTLRYKYIYIHDFAEGRVGLRLNLKNRWTCTREREMCPKCEDGLDTCTETDIHVMFCHEYIDLENLCLGFSMHREGAIRILRTLIKGRRD